MSHQTNRNKGGKESDIVQQLLHGHQEAIVIFLDPDEESQGESKIGVFTKLLKSDSRLSQVLESVLNNIRHTRDAKSSKPSRDPIKDQASGSQKEPSGGSATYNQGSGPTFCCQGG